jgi:hypothetical protein
MKKDRWIFRRSFFVSAASSGRAGRKKSRRRKYRGG